MYDAISTMHMYTLMYTGKTTHFAVCVLSSKGFEILVDADQVQIVFYYTNARRGRRAPVYYVCHCSGAVHGSTFPMLAAAWMPGSTFPMLAASSMPLSKTQHKDSILFAAGILLVLVLR